MQNIMLSAHFDLLKNPERIAFLERVQARLPRDIRLVAFNLSGHATATFPVVVGYEERPKVFANVRERLRSLLIGLLANRGEALFEHAVSELSAMGGNFDRHIVGFIRRVERFVAAVERYRPVHCYLWNQFNAFHNVAEAYLRDQGVSVGFFHDGVLPGSIALDLDGEMGGSWVASQHEKLLSIPVSDADIESAERFLRTMAEKGASRHKQVQKVLVAEALEYAGLAGKKMIFYAGQNDWHAGILPESERRLIHSPLYGSSTAPLADLDRIAKQHDWAVIFKPHPLDRDKYAFLRAEEYERTLILGSTDTNVCIDACSVFATIASQTCYSAIMRGKPVVMLGKNQLAGKGLTYDVGDVSGLQDGILLAMEDPLGPERVRGMARHAAQLEKTYLFDYGLIENRFYKRGPAEFAALLAYAIGRSPEDAIEGSLESARAGAPAVPASEGVAA